MAEIIQLRRSTQFLGLFCVTMALMTGVAGAQDNMVAPPGLQKTETESNVPESDRFADLPQPGVNANNIRPPGLSIENNAPPELSVYEQQQQVREEIRGQAFEAALNGLLPLRPEEIRKLLEEYDKTREAVETPIYPYPTPETIVETLSLDPGVPPMVVKVATGHVTTLNIMDATGAPWPIQDITWAGNFEVVQPEEGGHVIRITPLSEFAYGNVSMRLVDLRTPLTLTLKTGRDSVYYRVDARIPEFGPLADVPLIEGGLSLTAGSVDSSAVLRGTPNPSLERLTVTGVDARTTAYRNGSTIYVRTPLTLLSPGWRESVQSGDGLNVYTLDNAPVLLLSDRGQMVRAYLQSNEEAEGDL